ncbi:MAG: hypothetical protein Q8M26_12945 [Pseudolabrys sp.]|nr:hypothetical protein [Pseudolabrys sp.]
MIAEMLNSIRPYAGWAALVLFVVGLFGGLIGNNAALPLTLILAAAGLAVLHFRKQLKTFDFWALDEWIRTRYDAFGVRDWHAPHHAAESYCSRVVVQARNEAAAEMNTIRR